MFDTRQSLLRIGMQQPLVHIVDDGAEHAVHHLGRHRQVIMVVRRRGFPYLVKQGYRLVECLFGITHLVGQRRGIDEALAQLAVRLLECQGWPFHLHLPYHTDIVVAPFLGEPCLRYLTRILHQRHGLLCRTVVIGAVHIVDGALQYLLRHVLRHLPIARVVSPHRREHLCQEGLRLVGQSFARLQPLFGQLSA